MSTSSWPTSESPKQISEAQGRLRQAYLKGLTPPPRISIPDWADEYRRHGKGAGSTSGRWRTSAVEIARGPMLAPTEPGVHIITAQVATQLLKTSLLENVFGYHAHLDPCPMLLVQPKEDAAEQFSKERITPLIKATPVLRKLVGSSKTRDSEDTLLYKAYPGGFLAMVGAGSPDNLARRPVRIVAYDEVDKYPPLIEGDTFGIGDERTATFPSNWLSIRVCSPTIEDESLINASYVASDQRRASLDCPHCHHRQFPNFFDHIQWDKTETGEHLWRTARLYCEACGVGWTEGERLDALSTIKWHQTRPFKCCEVRQEPLEIYNQAWRASQDGPIDQVWDWWASPRHAIYRAKCSCCGAWPVDNEHAGFKASKLYSPWTAKDGPAALAKKWLDAKDFEAKRQVFFNTQLAEVYRRHAQKEVPADVLAARREEWRSGLVPDGAAFITVGADFQGSKVEIETVAWGRDEESWSVDYEVIDGEFSEPSVQQALDEYLKRRWRRADGRDFSVLAACLDSGHHTEHVYRFSRERLGRNIWAVKGSSESSGQRSPVWPTKRPSSRTKKSFSPIILGVNTAKDVIAGYLRKETPGPGYMHFPHDRDVGYFYQLTAERLVTDTIAGRRVTKWMQISGRANEALDCRVYAYAALSGLIARGVRLNRKAAEVGAVVTRHELTSEEPVPPLEPPDPKVEPVVISPGRPDPAKKKSLASKLA